MAHWGSGYNWETIFECIYKIEKSLINISSEEYLDRKFKFKWKFLDIVQIQVTKVHSVGATFDNVINDV
jgi:hypothetical protein